MNAAHHMVSLDQAKAGMALSDDILDQQGQVLLAQGTVLTASTIAALARHDIAMLPIANTGEPEPAIDVVAVSARVDYLFRGNGAGPDAGPSDTATSVLHRYIADYRLDREVAP